MTRPMALLTACMLAISASSAAADLSVRFIEGAPKDRFSFVNTGSCPITSAKVVLDLAGAPSGLIFDVTEQGAGVSVYQPFEVVEGAAALGKLPQVLDGDNALLLDLKHLDPDQAVAFTIDIDDTGAARQTVVTGSEIAGALVRVTSAETTGVAAFDASARAIVRLAGCLS